MDRAPVVEKKHPGVSAVFGSGQAGLHHMPGIA
jgi:hypothetical protein